MTEKRTYQERRKYLLKAVQRRREKVRSMAVNYGGNRRQVCGYDRCMEALEFHHLDPTQKISVFPRKDIHEVGRRLRKRSKSAYSCAPTVIEKFMREYCSFHR
jgi:hypothetical protein